MCGIFGFIGNGKAPVNLKILQQIAVFMEFRGKDAFGFAWIDTNERLRMYKAAGKISENLGTIDFMENSFTIIGHTRTATQGEPQFNENNHPHHVNDGYFVHNGIIFNWEDILSGNEIWPVTDCDSEVIGLMIEKYKGSLLKRVGRSMRNCLGPQSAAMIWAKPRTVILTRKCEQPVHIKSVKNGIYFASTNFSLGGKKTTSMKDNTVIRYDSKNIFREKKWKTTTRKIDLRSDDYEVTSSVYGLGYYQSWRSGSSSYGNFTFECPICFTRHYIYANALKCCRKQNTNIKGEIIHEPILVTRSDQNDLWGRN